MKKFIISLVLLLMIFACATACGKTPTPTPTPGPGTQTDPPASASVYEVLNGLADKNYASVKLSVATVTGGIRLAANYALTQNQVTYSVEQICKLPTSGDFSNLPEDYKITLTGTAAVNGNKVVLDGAEVSIPDYNELAGDFDFAKENFANVSEKSGSFAADVISPSAFCDAAGVNDMKVLVAYSEAALNTVTVTYKTAISEVTATYEFVG